MFNHEWHLHFSNLLHGEDYEYEFNMHYSIPQDGCAIKVNLISKEDKRKYDWENWQLQLDKDIRECMSHLSYNITNYVWIESDGY